jgi:hypothetical protein
MATKKKRTMSLAQKAALAKGRAALKKKRGTTTKRKRKAVKKSSPRSQIILQTAPIQKVSEPRKKRKSTLPSTKNKGGTMARKKKKGNPGSTIKRAGSRATRFIKESGFIDTVKNTSLLIAGGVASAMVVNKIPVKDARIKAALPIIVGLGLAGTVGKQNAIARQIATGMMTIGMISLFKKFAPNVPMLAGEEVYYLPQYGGGYGSLPDYSGDTVDLSGNYQMGYDNFMTPASI